MAGEPNAAVAFKSLGLADEALAIDDLTIECVPVFLAPGRPFLTLARHYTLSFYFQQSHDLLLWRVTERCVWILHRDPARPPSARQTHHKTELARLYYQTTHFLTRAPAALQGLTLPNYAHQSLPFPTTWAIRVLSTRRSPLTEEGKTTVDYVTQAARSVRIVLSLPTQFR